MAWQQGPQDFSKLDQLGALAARLLRVVAYQAVRRGDVQLRAQGLPQGVSELYKEHAKLESHKLIPQKRSKLDYVRVVTSERSTF